MLEKKEKLPSKRYFLRYLITILHIFYLASGLKIFITDALSNLDFVNCIQSAGIIRFLDVASASATNCIIFYCLYITNVHKTHGVIAGIFVLIPLQCRLKIENILLNGSGPLQYPGSIIFQYKSGNMSRFTKNIV